MFLSHWNIMVHSPMTLWMKSEWKKNPCSSVCVSGLGPMYIRVSVFLLFLKAWPEIRCVCFRVWVDVHKSFSFLAHLKSITSVRVREREREKEWFNDQFQVAGYVPTSVILLLRWSTHQIVQDRNLFLCGIVKLQSLQVLKPFDALASPTLRWLLMKQGRFIVKFSSRFSSISLHWTNREPAGSWQQPTLSCTNLLQTWVVVKMSHPIQWPAEGFFQVWPRRRRRRKRWRRKRRRSQNTSSRGRNCRHHSHNPPQLSKSQIRSRTSCNNIGWKMTPLQASLKLLCVFVCGFSSQLPNPNPPKLDDPFQQNSTTTRDFKKGFADYKNPWLQFRSKPKKQLSAQISKSKADPKFYSFFFFFSPKTIKTQRIPSKFRMLLQSHQI